MAKGLDVYRERVNELSSFGKNLVRRSGSCCELCGAKGIKLDLFELPPVPKSPDYDRCLLLCEECGCKIDKPEKNNPNYWRCLNNTVWSEIAVIQALSIRILRRIEAENDWARELLDQVFPDPEVEELAVKY